MQDLPALIKRLEQQVDHADFEGFKKDYVDFLNRFPAFRDSYSHDATGLHVSNAVYGKDLFYLKQTSLEQGPEMLAAGRAASKAFAKLSLEDRVEYLSILKHKIIERKEEFKIAITADTGKPYKLAEGEMGKGGEWFDFAAQEAPKQLARKKAGPGDITRILRPKGVVQIIGAYNYPYALVIGGIVGALAGGNSVIVTAPSKAPNYIFPLKQAADDAMKEFLERKGASLSQDFKNNSGSLFQYSQGRNSYITENADVVHFVGGNEAGENIRQSRSYKKTILEMGGTNVAAVMASAVQGPEDAQKIAQTIHDGFGPATGQRCTAPRILCVQEGAEGVTDALKRLCEDGPKEGEIGNPWREGVKMGPLVDRNAHQRMADAIELAKKMGATVHGKLSVSNNLVPQAGDEGSCWVNPIVIDWSKASFENPRLRKSWDNMMENEIFGPLLHIVHPVKDLQGAIDRCNERDAKHGLAGAIFTKNPDDVEEYYSNVRVKSLFVNGAPKDLSPWGGHGHPGESGIGGDTHFLQYVDDRYIGNAGSVGMSR